MRFEYPLFPGEFEIPDEWLVEAGMVVFNQRGTAYRSAPGCDPVKLTDIAPPCRDREVPNTFRGFDRDRMVRALSGIVQRWEIPPVSLLLLPRRDGLQYPYRFVLTDGFHRFHASVAAGYKQIRATWDE
jgi:hypothetical protein